MNSTFMRRQSILMNPKTPEPDRKIYGLLLNDKADGISSKDLHEVAALTFNPAVADAIFRACKASLDPQQNTWQTILKATIVVDHLVRWVTYTPNDFRGAVVTPHSNTVRRHARFGAERCVDFAWDTVREIDALVEYNSALVKGSFGTKVRSSQYAGCLLPRSPLPMTAPCVLNANPSWRSPRVEETTASLCAQRLGHWQHF